jgi:hypothetical protein
MLGMTAAVALVMAGGSLYMPGTWEKNMLHDASIAVTDAPTSDGSYRYRNRYRCGYRRGYR